MLTRLSVLLCLSVALASADKLDPWPQNGAAAGGNQDFWWAGEPNPFDTPTQGRAGFSRTASVQNGNGRSSVSFRNGPGFNSVSSSSCAGAGCGGSGGAGGFNRQLPQGGITQPNSLYSAPAQVPARRPAAATPARAPGSVQRFTKPQQHASRQNVASSFSGSGQRRPSNNGGYSPQRQQSVASTGVSNHRRQPAIQQQRPAVNRQQHSPQRQQPANNQNRFSPQPGRNVQPQQSFAGYQNGQQNGNTGNAGAEGPVVRACSASLECVARDACDPYTGFLLAPGEGPFPQLDQPTVSFTRCFMSKNGQVGVCCQEPHVNDPWTDRPPTNNAGNGNGFGNGFGNNGAANQQSYNSQQPW